MNSPKLCIVACHSDTPLKKQIIQFNHPILQKLATTIYINSSRYDKSIRMIHTTKLDKYEKYQQILSTVLLVEYKVLIFMTDEVPINFSFTPFVKLALQHGYHSYNGIEIQTPQYYMNPYPIPTIVVPPVKQDPSLFKSQTTLSTTYTNYEQPNIPESGFVLSINRSLKPFTLISNINAIVPSNNPIPNSKEQNWITQLLTLRNIPLPKRVDDSIYETVLIAFQPLPHLEFLLRKTILYLPKWSHTVVCGNKNTEMIQQWNLPIEVISLDIDDIDDDIFNEMLLMESFWMLFHGETLLTYTKDSTPLDEHIEQPDKWLQDKCATLENGMTIRNKKAIMERLTTLKE